MVYLGFAMKGVGNGKNACVYGCLRVNTVLPKKDSLKKKEVLSRSIREYTSI